MFERIPSYASDLCPVCKTALIFLGQPWSNNEPGMAESYGYEAVARCTNCGFETQVQETGSDAKKLAEDNLRKKVNKIYAKRV